MKFIDKNVLNHKFTKLLHQQPYRVCTKTIMDTSDINISFDKDGVSNHFYIYKDFMDRMNNEEKKHILINKE